MNKFIYVSFVTDKSLQLTYDSRITFTCYISWSTI